MDARLNYFEGTVAEKAAKHINSAGKVLTDSTLPAATQELVKIRASQINGCGFCTDMHTKDAAARRGRPRSGSTWSPPGGRRRSSPRPSAPRWSSPSRAPGSPTPPAASPTRPGRTPPSTTTSEQLAALVSLIAIINAYNRINVITQQPAGDYQPGQFADLTRSDIPRDWPLQERHDHDVRDA